MLKIAVTATALVLASSAAFASFTVYQGRSGKVLGTFDTRREARQFVIQHKGRGESVVNDKSGKEIKVPGRGGYRRASGGGGGNKHHN